jgi:hypothetical protein
MPVCLCKHVRTSPGGFGSRLEHQLNDLMHVLHPSIESRVDDGISHIHCHGSAAEACHRNQDLQPGNQMTVSETRASTYALTIFCFESKA